MTTLRFYGPALLIAAGVFVVGTVLPASAVPKSATVVTACERKCAGDYDTHAARMACYKRCAGAGTTTPPKQQ